MRTLVFCTAYAGAPSVWGTRYRRWLDAILAGGIEPEQILLVDDGSATLPGWADTDVYSGGVAGEAFTTGPRGRILLYHFRDRLGRRSVLDFAGWHRSFVFAALYAEAQGFDRIIHIESDAYVISAQARAFLTEFKDGWASFWSPLYSIPESAIQVVAGEGLRLLAGFAREPYEKLIGKPHELEIPFTHVERRLKGDRYAEGKTVVPRDADYAAQVPDLQDESYYWWLQGSQRLPAVSSVTLRFGELGQDTGALVNGWAQGEVTHHWMIGPESVIRLPGIKGGGEGRLTLKAVPFILAGQVDRQRLILEVNNVRLQEFDVTQACSLSCPVPAGVLRVNGQNMLRLIHPDAAVPSTLSPKFADTRRLSLSVTEVTLERW